MGKIEHLQQLQRPYQLDIDGIVKIESLGILFREIGYNVHDYLSE
jgi:hypothetical protein